MKFSPAELIKEFQQSGLNPSLFEKVDERHLKQAPNFLEWVVNPQYLNSLVLPKQVSIGTLLFSEHCPRCSKEGYIENLYDESIGMIKQNIAFLEYGKCPKCNVTRFELFKSGELQEYNELVGAQGQRCVPEGTLLYTSGGIKTIEDSEVKDELTHGPIIEKFDSGKVTMRTLVTKMNYSIRGAKSTHKIAIINEKLDIEFKSISSVKIGDCVVMCSPNLWPEKEVELPLFKQSAVGTSKIFNFPKVLNSDIARFIGYLISNGQHSGKYGVRVISSDPEIDADIKRLTMSIFEELPTLEEERPCKDGKTHRCWSISGINVMGWLNRIGLKLTTGRDECIPNAILQSPKKIVGEFLAGLFGGDGNFLIDGNCCRIQYTSVSKKLTKQLRNVLFNFGILTRCEKILSHGKESYFMSTKNSNSVAIFREWVPIVEEWKKIALNLVKPKNKSIWYTPLKNYTKTKSKRYVAPEKIRNLMEKGYFFLPIEKIEEDVENVQMYDVSIPDTNSYTGDCFLHHNSGKSKGVGLFATYILHRFLCIPNPLRHFGQPAGEMLTGTFSALSAEQAERNLWGSFIGFMDASPWFNNYHKFLKEESKRLKVELYTKRKSYIMYNHKKIVFQFTGSHAKMLRGATRIFASIDELGWFLTDDTKELQIMNADEVYSALSNSLATMKMKHRLRFNEQNYNNPPIVMANISSPSSAKDKIMRLIRDAKYNKKILAIHLSSWKCNPDYTYESLKEEFSHMDDVTFMRDFGAEPPMESSPFLAEHNAINRVATLEPIPKFEIKVVRDKDGMGDNFISGKLKVISGDKLTPRMLSFDLGHTKNGLALTAFSIGPDSKLRLDYIFALSPEKNRNINAAHFFENVTMPLVQNFHIAHVFFDRWQSLDQVSRLRDVHVDASQYSLKYREMEEIKGIITNKGVLLPKMGNEEGISFYVDKWMENSLEYEDSPTAALGIQLLTVRDLGHRMAKPLQGDDDIFRAFCLGVNRMNDPKIRKVYNNGPRGTSSIQSVMPLGSVFSRSDKSHSYRSVVSGDTGSLGMVVTKKRN